jgi:hypothetical protein
MGFGRHNPFPFRFGGGQRAKELAHEALVEAYAPVLDVSEAQIAESEACAEAACLAMVWASGKRAANQAIPAKMLEWVEQYEQILLTHPGPRDHDHQRRAEIAAKFRALIGNAEPDIYEACSLILGINIVDVHYLDVGDCTVYLPGINPGPPGLEWMSQTAVARVQVNGDSLTQEQYDAKVEKLAGLLESLLPVWMQYQVFRWDSDGVSSGFVLGISMLGEVAL